MRTIENDLTIIHSVIHSYANAWSYEPVSYKKQIKDNLKIEPSIKVYTNLAKALECAFKDQSELWYGLYLDTPAVMITFKV